MTQTDKNILQLAIPSIVSNITVPLLGLADLSIVGHLGSEQYIAAIAVGTMIFNVLYWLFGFLRMGTSGMTSQALGRGDHAAVELLLRRSLYVSMATALTFVVLQMPLRWLALTVIAPSAQIRPFVSTYFNIVIWGAPAMLGLYGVNGWFVGLQNTRVPMVVAIFQNVVNIAVSLVLVIVFGMQLQGVAMGTLAAQWSGFALAIAMVRRQLLRDARKHPSSLVSRQVSLVSWSAFFTVNRDIFLRTLCLVAVNLFFTSAGARQGDMVLAVNTLLLTFFTLFSYVMDGFAFAGEALTGKLYGAADFQALRATVRRLMEWGIVMVLAFTTVYVLGGERFLMLITDNREVVAAAGEYFPWACLIPLAGVAAFVYDGIFIGLTATRGMLLSSAIATAVFFILFFVGTVFVDANHVLWFSFVVYLASRGAVQWLIMRYKFRW